MAHFCFGKLPRNSEDRLTDWLDMTLVVDCAVKSQRKQNNEINIVWKTIMFAVLKITRNSGNMLVGGFLSVE